MMADSPYGFASEGPLVDLEALSGWMPACREQRSSRPGVSEKAQLVFPRGRAFEPGGMIRYQIPQDLVILYEEVWGLFVKHGGAIENTGDYLNYESPLEDNFDQDIAKHLHP